METGINSARVYYCCQTTPDKLRQVVRDMLTDLEAEQHQQRETLKKLQEEIKDLRKLLEKVVENSTESSVKETEHSRSVCDQLDENVEKMSEELKKLTDYYNNTELNETAGCEQGTGLNLPRQGEFTMDVNTLSSSERHGNATSPIDLKQSKSEGKFASCVFLQITYIWDRCSVALENYSLVWNCFHILVSVINSEI